MTLVGTISGIGIGIYLLGDVDRWLTIILMLIEARPKVAFDISLVDGMLNSG